MMDRQPLRNRFNATLRAVISVAWLFVLAAVALPAQAAFNNTTPRGTFAGKHNYVITGNTLRSQSNDGNACAVVAAGTGSSATVAGIPGGSTIMGAYLYWAGSGNTDANVTFAGHNITAQATFTDNFQTTLNNQDYDLDYFGGFYDVTAWVTGNGSYTFSGLTVATTDNFGGNADADYCGPEAVIAGWSLVVVYSNPAEPYRYTRVYDGLKFFRGSSVTTTQSGFRVPDLQNGKVSIVTWEGDPDAGDGTSSFPLDGFTEALSFEGHQLLNSGCDGTDNLYNSTIGNLGLTCNGNSWGVDIDTYDVTNYLYEGQTGATLEYSSGNDLVFLAAQVISTTNTPVADLAISKTHNGSNFTAGQNGSYNIDVQNLGPEIATGTATVTDTLPTGLTFVSGTGTGWTCSVVGQTVTCNNSAPSIALNAHLPALTLTVAVDGTAAASTQNIATVTHPMFDGTGGNSTSSDTVTVKKSNLSTSTKTVVDVNGGTVQPGDTLRYTITLNAASGANVIDATGVSVVDDLAANLGDLQIVSIPAGATDSSIGSGGANGTGQVNVSNITVPAGTSRTIVFDVVVSNDALPGEHIDNSATIANPTGPGANPSAPQQTIPDPAPPTTGNKVLYVYDKQSAPTQSLSRTPQPTTTTGTNYVIVAGNNSQTWPLAGPVATGKSLVLPQQTITVYLEARTGTTNLTTSRSTTVSLLHGNTVIATSAAQNINSATTARKTYTIAIPLGGYTFTGSDNLSLRFDNDGSTTHAANREVWVYGRQGTTSCVTSNTCSKITFNSNTVINVDSVEMYSAPYPATTQKTEYEAGDHVYIRADISDPFGGYDVSGARLLIKDGDDATVASNLVMTAMTSPAFDSGTPNRILEYDYIIPASPNYGTFTATVTGAEGGEGTVTHTRPNTFTVVPNSAPPATGNKQLYLLTPGTLGGQRDLTRTRPTTNQTMTWASGDGNQDFYLPALAKGLILNNGTVSVQLFARRSGTTGARRFRVHLYLNTTGTSISVDSTDMDFNVANYTTRSVNLTLSNGRTSFNAGDRIILRVQNRDTRDVQLTERDGTDYSFVQLNAATVINVDSVEMYSAAYPATTQKTQYDAGDHVYIRADISDPFGGYDVSGATLLLKDGSNATVVSNMVLLAKTSPAYDSGTPNRILEYDYTIPGSPNYGTFTATVTGAEGSEGTITHSRLNTFAVERKALDVVKAHSGDFTAGANNSYTLTVNNSGGTTVAGTTTVKDTLATGLTFVAGTGTGWTCSAAGQVVTCTSTTSVAASSSMAPITLTVAVAGNMGTSVANQASVGNSTIASGFQKSGNTDTAIIRHSDLSTSTKAVTDLNGGDANPGDTLRYTITVKESAGYAANSVTVSDPLPTGLTGLTGLNTGLSTCSGTPSVVGSTLTVTGLSLAGGATCTLVFDVQVSGSAGTGLVIDNTATITNPAGPGATKTASITVAQSQVAASGNKILYVYANDTMTRIAQSSPASNTTASGVSVYHDFVLPGVSSALNIAAGSTINVDLWLARNGSTTTTTRNVYVKLFKRVGVTDTQIGDVSGTVTFTSTALAKQSFTITAPSFGSAGNLAVGDKLVLRIYNDSDTGGNDRSVLFQQFNSGSGSTVTVSTPTVVHVDSVNVYSAVYPATTQAAAYGQGDIVYVRASVSDPFGFLDISGGSVAIKNPSGTTVATATLVNGTHTVGVPLGATRVYEYAYTVPVGAPTGAWTASVTANEGAEGTITHTGNGTFAVGGKLTLRKTWGVGATAGDAVTLAIGGGTSATAGSSTAPSTLTPATSNAATGATITLTEAFTTGLAGDYTITLACTKDSDGTTVSPAGAGLSRTITMPAGSVTCTYTNSKSVPLMLVKLATTLSDPINGTTNPKAIPGAVVEYQIIVTNPATTPADAGTVFVFDQIPAHMNLMVTDIGSPGSGPVQFVDGSPSSGLTYTPASDVVFSSNGGSTWTYPPSAGADGTDPAVTNVRVAPQGAFNASGAQFTLKLRMRIE
jgi:uncharacterized repeat protein (TIGR01451 family)/fimbrial isopeptide formation D2 family protein